MRQLVFSLFIISSILWNRTAEAQTKAPDIYRDSVVQLYGVIMTADSLKAIPFASVVVNKKGR